MDEYTQRNEILRALGFRDYKMYLRSDLWKEIRAKQIEAYPECYGCGRGDDRITLQVHHGAYTVENLMGLAFKDLYTICARCHKWIEITPKGYKRNPEQATKELHKIRGKYVRQ